MYLKQLLSGTNQVPVDDLRERFTDSEAWKAVDDALLLPGLKDVPSVWVFHDAPEEIVPKDLRCEAKLSRNLLPKAYERNVLPLCGKPCCKLNTEE